MKLATLEADLTLNTGSFNTGVQQASEKISGLKTDLNGLQEETKNTGTILESALGYAIGDFIGEMAGAMTDVVFEIASDGVVLAASMETLNKTMSMTFGDSQTQIDAWAKTAKKSFGVGAVAAKQYAVDIGEALKSTGASENELANMSTDLIGVAADLAAIKGMSVGDAISAILSAFRGEADPIERFNLDMKDSAMAAYAMKKGLIDAASGWSKLSEAEKDMARYSYIMEATADKQGYFAKNSDDYNQQIALMATNIEQLKLSVGSSLLPVMTELVSWFNALFGGTENTGDAMKSFGASLGETYANIDTTTANALALVNALSQMEKQGVETAEEQNVWNQLLQNLSKTLPGIDSVINTTTGVINGGTEALKAYVIQWQETQRQIALSSALQSAQAEVVQKQATVYKLQAELDAMNLTDKQIEERTNQYLDKARKYYGLDENVENATVHAMLEEDRGNAYAEYLYSAIDALLSDDDQRESKEAELLAAKAELEDLSAKYMALEAQVNQLSQETEKKEQPKPEAEPKPGEGQGGGGAPQPVNITLNATIDGQDVAATLVPKVTGQVMSAIDWRFQQKTR